MEKQDNKKSVKQEIDLPTRQRRSHLIGLLSAMGLAIVLVIVEGCLGHFSSIFALACVCFTWAGVYYILQFCLVKRDWQTLVVGIVDAIIALTLFVFFIMALVW